MDYGTIDENRVGTSEADCQLCWITVTVLKNEQGPKSQSGPNNNFVNILTPELVFLLHVKLANIWIAMGLLKCIVSSRF